MPSLEKINLLTAQCNNSTKRRFVVGIKNNEEALWEDNSPYKYGDTQPAHHPPLNESTLDVSVEFGNRLFSFYRSYLSPEQPAGHYNCHRFSLWMIGSSATERPGYLSDAEEIESTILKGEVVSGGLSLGQLGVLGYLSSERAFAYHSLIGLENQTEIMQCIQVAGMGGRLKVSSYSDASGRYISEGMPTGSLYTLN